MSKAKQVKWNGHKDDPDHIVQYGVRFEKGEWTTLPDNLDPKYLDKFRHASVFEVKGEQNAPDSSDTASPPVIAGVAHPPATTYRVQGVNKGRAKKPSFWVIVGENGVAVDNGDEYADEASAQVVADAMNKVPAA